MTKDDQDVSLRKLLSLHLSIYSALNNPELDINFPAPDYTPPPLDFPVAMLPWLPLTVNTDPMQDLARMMRSASASLRPQSASILSSTSEEDLEGAGQGDVQDTDASGVPYMVLESMVMVPLLRSAVGSVMVFDTDEEDEYTHASADDDRTLTNNLGAVHKSVGMPANLHSTFVMPRMSLDGAAHLTVLSTCSDAVRTEINALMEHLRRSVDVPRHVHVHHVVIALVPLAHDVAVMRSLQLVFIVNDGSKLFVDFMDALLECGCDTPVPKLTVINVMTTNYFVNLFEIINTTRPHQIWKTPLLRNAKLLDKMTAYITDELGDGDTSAHASALKSKSSRIAKKYPESKSMYDSLIPTRKPDYKNIERQIRSEMLMSLSYADIDPLQLSSNLSHLRALVAAFRTYFNSRAQHDLPRVRRNVWLICSFSVGIGVGVTVASGAVTHLGRHVGGLARNLRYTDLAAPCKQLAAQPAIIPSDNITDKFLAAVDALSGSLGTVSKALTDNVVVNTAIEYLNMALQELRDLSSLAMRSILGGFKKSTSAVVGMVW